MLGGGRWLRLRGRTRGAEVTLTPEAMYRVGLVVQTVDDAGADGLTVAELEQRTKLDIHTLVDVLALCVAREYV